MGSICYVSSCRESGKGLFICRHVFHLLLLCNGQIYKSTRWFGTMTAAIKGRRAGNACVKVTPLPPGFQQQTECAVRRTLVGGDCSYFQTHSEHCECHRWPFPFKLNMASPWIVNNWCLPIKKYLVVLINCMYLIGNNLVAVFVLYIIFSTKLVYYCKTVK